jgi:hypothetical protein
MATFRIHKPVYWMHRPASPKHKANIGDLLQETLIKKNPIIGASWFKYSLIAQVILFLPLPALLILYYHAPFIIIAVTVTLFFVNIIDDMAGSGTRAITSVFAIALIDLFMLAMFVL